MFGAVRRDGMLWILKHNLIVLAWLEVLYIKDSK